MIATVAEGFFPVIAAIVAIMWKAAFVFNAVRLFTRASILPLFICVSATDQ